MSNNTYKAFDFYKENEFIVHNNDGSTNIITMKTIPAEVPETVVKLFPTLDRKVIKAPKTERKQTIFDRLCQVDKDFNAKFKEIIRKNSLVTA
jgi:hypothetical protein